MTSRSTPFFLTADERGQNEKLSASILIQMGEEKLRSKVIEAL
jgi:hypothetical protein